MRTVRRQESPRSCNAAWSWERTGRSVLGGAWPRGGSLQSPGNRLRGRNGPARSSGFLPVGRKIPHAGEVFALFFASPVAEMTGWGRDREGLMGMEFKVEGDAPLRVIVADDDPLARRMLRDVLQQSGITVIAEAGSGREAVELTAYYTPDVVVMDLIMPGMDGLAAMGEIRRTAPDVRVVILTSSDDDEVGLMTLRAGASGFLCKNVGIDALPRALHCAKNGEAVITRRLTMRLIEDLRMVRTDSAGLRPIRSQLTSREWEVLDLLCQDLSTDEIADRLVVSVETVRSHVKNVLRKLEVRSRRDAVAAASRLRAGMLEDGLPAEE
ncbi:MAG TPA: response regulator transcription factor [Baekduia sp.]|nr:response regulator transcription factor [Baekduia sp.]